MNPEASVIIIVRNGAGTIRRQLDALAKQVDAPNFEIIVVDNGSTDGTATSVRSWMAEGIGAASAARLITADDRASIPYARNTGAAAAQGRLLLWCDADDKVGPQWVRAFCSHVTRGAAGGQSHARHADGTPEPDFIPIGLLSTEYLPYASNSNLAVVTADFRRVGGYDESLPPYGAEDLELCWRLQEHGLPMTYVPTAEVDYTLSGKRRRLRKEYRTSIARMAAKVRHPRSFGERPPRMGDLGITAARQILFLPYHAVRPAPWTRARRIRHTINAVGNACGYWTYALRKVPSRLLPASPAASDPALTASVIIIVRNGADTILRQLDALAAQIDAPPYEVIVVDNASTDATTDLVSAWITEHGGSLEARLVPANDRPGIPYARNTGARAARGQQILWCDADDAVHPEWVRELSVAVGKGIACGRLSPWRNGKAAPGLMHEGLVPTEYLPHVPGCNFGIDRDLFFELGAFDESLPRYGCEDVDISWRAQESGYSLGYAPDAVVDFTVTPSTRAVKKTFLAAKARIAMSVRHPASLQGRSLTLRGLLMDSIRQTIRLPLSLVLARGVSRSRQLRGLVASFGRLAGYWTYGLRRKPPQLVRDTV